MLPKTHIILGAIFSIFIYAFFHISLFNVLIIFLATFFIDFDHYILFFYRKKSLNLKKAYYWFKEKRKKWFELSIKEREKYTRPYFPFHSIEFWILLLFLSFVNKAFLFILIGILFHMMFDYIEIIYIKDKFYSKFSLIWTYVENKNKKYSY